MLNTGRLDIAGVSTSKNALLTDLMQAIAAYNAFTSLARQQSRVDALDSVAVISGLYLTSKPPQAKPKNLKRWNALRDLAIQVGQEAGVLGVKLLKGPADYRKISSAVADQSYWLERLDPEHRPGYQLSSLFAGWLKDTTAIATKKSFWEFIGTDFNIAADHATVKYYPSIANKRGKYQVMFEGGDLKDKEHDDLFDTSLNCTHFSGDGWAIFVCSPQGELFAGNHKAGEDHHSSFLGGGAVIAAGEMSVEDGVVRVITAKSGHYAPGADDMKRLVLRFGGIPGGSIIRPDLEDMKKFKEIRFHTVAAFRGKGVSAPVLKRGQVLSLIPAMSQSHTAPNGSNGFDDVMSKVTA